MTVRSMLSVTILALGAASSGCVHQQNAVRTNEAYPTGTNGSYLTGSYVPQDVNRNGPVTNGKNDVRVIDRNDINQSGGANVGQSLRQLGVNH